MKKRFLIGAISLFATFTIAGCGIQQAQSDKNQMNDHQMQGHQMSNMQSHNQPQQNKKTLQVHTTWRFANRVPTANQQEKLTIQIHELSGKPVKEFEINHEKKMHLIIVSQDLSFFNHIHPEFKGGGRFEVNTQFPRAGKYRMFVDFVPKGYAQASQNTWVDVRQNNGSAVQEKPIVLEPLQPDQKLTKVVDGKEIHLSFDKELKANQEIMLNFNIKDAKTKKSITDLQPYLGAVGHVVILSSDTEKFLHVHPMDEKTTGPNAKFHTSFPTSGTYKIWGQFQHDGKVFTVSFVVKVS